MRLKTEKRMLQSTANVAEFNCVTKFTIPLTFIGCIVASVMNFEEAFESTGNTKISHTNTGSFYFLYDA